MFYRQSSIYPREHQKCHLFGPCKSLRLCEEVGKGHEEDQGQVGEKEH